jgi:hypothetical protein
MKYNAPYGSVDPNASYVDRDTPAAISGSKVPAAAIETVQRELVALISAAGLTPDNADLTQIAKAIQSGKLNYAVATGTSTALIVTLPQVPSAYVAGMVIEVKTASACGGACTINVNGLGAKSIVDANGGALVANSFQAGNMLALIYDGTNFRMVGGYSAAVLSPFSITYAVSQGLANSVFALSGLGTGSASFGSSSGSSFTFSRAGKYAIAVQMNINVVYTGPTNVAAGVEIKRNGTVVIGSANTDSNYGSTSTGFTLSSIAIVDVAAGDIMTAWGFGGSSAGYTSSAITSVTFNVTAIS